MSSLDRLDRLDRRVLLARGAVAAGGVLTGGGLLALLSCGGDDGPSGRAGSTTTTTATAASGRRGQGGYGPLQRVADQDGEEVLALPAGFSYVTFSRIGDPMDDGTPVPQALDGMAAFAAPGRRRGRGGGRVLLIRNHEVRTGPGAVEGSVQGPEDRRYDPLAGGGTTSVLFDPGRGRVERQWVSFSGSIVNCAGGTAYEGAGWITCEETIGGTTHGWERNHGYTFLVPTGAEGAVAAEPLAAMGRFAHEAVAVDPDGGVVYETEDDGDDSGLYRFTPRDPADLTRGGRLQMLGIAGQDGYDTLTGQEAGRSLPVRWVDVDDPDPDLEGGATPVARQGLDAGAARFNRLEGIGYDPATRGIYVSSTSGGDARCGQVWHYDPRAEELTLLFESPGGSVLDSPDNLVVTPRGGLLLCEDDASGDDGHPLAPDVARVNRLVGITPGGEAFELAVCLRASELAGVCFSPGGEVLFVNVFGDGTPGSGMTCAITGPWRRGAL